MRSSFITVLLSIGVWLFAAPGCRHTSKTDTVATASIDSVYTATNQKFRKTGEYEQLIKINFDLIEQSEEIGYDKGVIRSYINVANLLRNLERNEDALETLNLIKPLIKRAKDPSIEARLYYEYMINYERIGLSRATMNSFYQSLAALEKVNNKQVKAKAKYNLFQSRAVKFVNEEQEDSALVYFKKAYHQHIEPLVCSNIARSFLMIGPQLDSALVYLYQSDSLLKAGDYPVYQEARHLRIKGMYFKTIQQYDSSIQYNLQSVQIFERMGRAADVMDNYKTLYDLYALTHNDLYAKRYLKSYTNLNDSLHNLEKRAINASVLHLLHEAQEKDRYAKRSLLMIITIIVSVAGIGAIVWHISYNKLRRKHKHKSSLLTQKVKETEQLKSKVNDSFRELISLAKGNDPSFYTRFKEVHPFIHQQLLSIQPELRLSELTLCAYIYLDFSSKDIAEYTFKSVRTVQTRKSNLRKRLVISSGEDLYTWMKHPLNHHKWRGETTNS